MTDGSVKEFGRWVTVALADGHEFEFEAHGAEQKSVRLFAERWKNRRLPLDAEVCRSVARVVAEQRLRHRGLI